MLMPERRGGSVWRECISWRMLVHLWSEMPCERTWAVLFTLKSFNIVWWKHIILIMMNNSMGVACIITWVLAILPDVTKLHSVCIGLLLRDAGCRQHISLGWVIHSLTESPDWIVDILNGIWIVHSSITHWVDCNLLRNLIVWYYQYLIGIWDIWLVPTCF